MVKDKELEEIKKKKLVELMRRINKSRQLSHEAKISKPVEVGDDSFMDFIGKHKLVVVDFWAPWCPPCKIIAPTIEKLAKQYTGKITFAKINIDKNPKTALAYGVTSIPTLVIIRDGVEVDRIVGAVPEEIIRGVLSKHLT